MKRQYSSLTFNNLARNLLFIEVIWNNKVIYNDYDNDATADDYDNLIKNYGTKIVYEMKITVVDGHHCILNIQGED